MKALPNGSRRVLLLGGVGLALTLLALATAVWALVQAEGDRARRRTQDRAARFATDLLTEIARDVVDETDAHWIVLDGAFRPVSPAMPRAFTRLPEVVDDEAAFFVGLVEDVSGGSASGEEAAAALRLAMASSDSVVRLRAALAAAQQGGDAAELLVTARVPAALLSTRDAVHLGLLAGTVEALRNARAAFGGPDEDVARALLLGATSMEANEVEAAVRGRQRALEQSRQLAALVRVAPPISEDQKARVLVADGHVVVGVPDAPRSRATSAPTDAAWWVRRAEDPAALRFDGGTWPDGLRILPPGARATRDDEFARLPGSGGYRVAARPDTQASASVLLIAGFSVASIAAMAAFVAFARGVSREARLARLRSEFVATVGHELRTPVAVIRSSAEALALGRATREEDRTRLVKGIVRESERLSGLLDNVLDFARMESGRRRFALAECGVGDVVRETVEAHRAALDRAGLRVKIDVDDALPRLRCDRDALGAALVNLLDNAAKFAGDRRDVIVRVHRDGGAIILAVIDHGPGVPEAERERVFERFFRGAASDVQETRGTGIGLALVRHAAEAHDGRVEVVETDGGGATFRMWLPLEAASREDEGD